MNPCARLSLSYPIISESNKAQMCPKGTSLPVIKSMGKSYGQWGCKVSTSTVALVTPSFCLHPASGMRSEVGWHLPLWALPLGVVRGDMTELLQGSRYTPFWCSDCYSGVDGICWVGPWVGSKDYMHQSSKFLYSYVLPQEMPVHDDTSKKVT